VKHRRNISKIGLMIGYKQDVFMGNPLMISDPLNLYLIESAMARGRHKTQITNQPFF